MSALRHDAWILTIGDELLRGEIVDSNKSFLSERLLRLELETARHVSVRDDPGEIREVLLEAARRARFVVCSGGLGPTRDDITTEVVARTFERPLVRDAETLERMRAYFASVGREMSENNAKQADFPQGGEVLPNAAGTAPGFMLETSPGGALLFCLPGVPRELYRMMDEQVMPRVEARLARDGGTPRVVRATLIRTFGLGESALDRDLGDLARDDPDVVLGFRTQFPDNLVRVLARGASASEAESKLERMVAEVLKRLGSLAIDRSERKLEEIVGELLITRGATVALAESCTGGLIAHVLTQVPGASAYLLEGVVAYSNSAKVRALDVSPGDLERFGAVSEPVARQMAEGARRRAGADFGLATTGVAGPTGGSDDKPVGTLFVALADAQGSVARRYQLMRDRERNKQLAAQIALEWLRRRLLGLELPEETFPRMRALRGSA
jgi:nicotinamide-nucleotide amidase